MKELRCCAAVAVGMATAMTVQGQATWVHPMGGGWFDANNWSTLNVPDTAGESAFLGLGTPYSVGVGFTFFQISTITVDNPNARLLLSGADIVAGGSPGVINRGTIVATGALTGEIENAAGGIFEIDLGESLVLSGPDLVNNGQFLLGGGTGTTSGKLTFDFNTGVSGTGPFVGLGAAEIRTDAGAVVDFGAATVIRDIDLEADFVNRGAIDAENTFVTIREPLSSASGTYTNNGTITASNGNTVSIANGVLNGSGTLVAEDASRVSLGGSLTVEGQFLQTSGSGEVSLGGATLKSVINQGFLIHDSSVPSFLEDAGLSNAGVFQLGDNSSTFSRLEIIGATKLSGSGTLDFRDGRIRGVTGDATLDHGVGHTIDGEGDFEDLTLINRGTILANAGIGSIDFEQTVVVQNENLIRADSVDVNVLGASITQMPGARLVAGGGNVDFSGNASLVGGELDATSSSARVFGDTFFDDVEISGLVEVFAGDTLSLGASITNDGTIVVNESGFSPTSSLEFTTSTSVGGNGTILLNSNTRATLEGGPAPATLGAGQTLAGDGDVNAELVLEGLLAPGIPGGDEQVELEFSRNLTIASTGTVEIEMASSSFSQRDIVDSTAAVDLAGALEVVFVGGYEPVRGERLPMVTAASVVDTFDTLDLPATSTPGLAFRVVYSSTLVELVATCPEDVNGDNAVTPLDISLVLANFGATSPIGPVPGDVNGDNAVTPLDISAVLAAFGATCL